MTSVTAPRKKVRPKLSPEGRNALRALRQGIALAAQEARQAGLTMAVWQDGRVVRIRP